MPRRPRTPRPRSAGPGRRCWNSAAPSGDWAAALSALDRNSRYGLIDKTEYKRQRAVLLTARALAAEPTASATAPARSRSMRLKLAPTLVPAAELAGRLLGEAGELRRASRIIEKAWAANPHPDLAETYAHLRPGDSARERLARVQSLALQGARPRSTHRERAGGGARGARCAGVRGGAERDPAAAEGADAARRHPDGGDRAARERRRRPRPRMDGRARCARARDPAWSADGFVSDRWMPVSPVSGRLDAFQWKVPLAELGDAREVIEADELDARQAAGHRAPPPARPPEARRAPRRRAAEPAAPAPAPPAALAGSAPKPPKIAPRVEAVIPLLHVPDDPGPEPRPISIRNPSRRAARAGLRLFK